MGVGCHLLLAEPEPSGWASQQGSTLPAVPAPPGLAPRALTLAQQPISLSLSSPPRLCVPLVVLSAATVIMDEGLCCSCQADASQAPKRWCRPPSWERAGGHPDSTSFSSTACSA